MIDVPSHERDADLMLRAARGEAGAFRTLSDLYLTRILNHAHRLLGNVAEAEEVTQDAFVKLWQQATAWQARAKVSTWLFRVVHNLCIDRLRRRKPDGGDAEEVAQDSIRPAHMLQRRQTAEAVRAAIAELPERQRHALELSHFEELTNPEIADIVGISVDAVESLLARARQKLRTALAAERGHDDEQSR